MLGFVDPLEERRLLKEGLAVDLVLKQAIEKIYISRCILSVRRLYSMSCGRGMLEYPIHSIVYKTQLILLKTIQLPKCI